MLLTLFTLTMPLMASDRLFSPNDSILSIINDPSFRPEIEAISSLESYDTIFLGYPLWWQQAPPAVYTFVENTDLSGKTIIPFTTSQASSLGNSTENLESASDSDTTWLEGVRFRERVSDNDVISWLESLNI